MRKIAVAILGGLIGIVLIRLGFNVRFGSSIWIGPPWAYPISVVSGALLALVLDHTIRTA